MREFIRRHRGLVTGAVVLAVGLAVFGIVWFQPQKLFIETTVDEAFPDATSPTAPAATASAPAATPGPTVLSQGTFRSLEHTTTGSALVVRLPDGSHVVRLQELSTSNGPDLRVYLSPKPASDDWRGYAEGALDLGALKGNRGSQNYDVPSGTDLSRFRSVVVWCRRFTVGFGAATLT